MGDNHPDRAAVIHHIAVSSQAPAIARSIVGEDLPPTIDSGKLADAQLVASELAQNVVRHSSSGPDEEFSLEVQTDADRIRIIVVDDGSGFSRDELLPASEDPWSGEGLRLVDAIASRWGADRSAGGGTIAWAEIDA